MKNLKKLLTRTSVKGIFVVVAAFAILGCCCPVVPLPLAQEFSGQPQDEVVPVEVLAGPMAMQ